MAPIVGAWGQSLELGEVKAFGLTEASKSEVGGERIGIRRPNSVWVNFKKWVWVWVWVYQMDHRFFSPCFSILKFPFLTHTQI